MGHHVLVPERRSKFPGDCGNSAHLSHVRVLERQVVRARLGRFATERDIGILAIDPSTRHRIRVNGRARAANHRLVITTEQVYSNCSKYIQQRVLTSTAGLMSAGHRTYTGRALTSRQQDWLAWTDTFVIASAGQASASMSRTVVVRLASSRCSVAGGLHGPTTSGTRCT